MANETETKHDPQDQFSALLEGLRVTLPGVQLLGAFLLTLPLYPRFESLSTAEHGAYYTAFGCAITSSLLLMAPSSHQRLRAGRTVARRSQDHVDVAVRLTVGGTVFFALALVAVTYLVASIVGDTNVAIGVSAAVALLAGWSWFWLPLVTFRNDPE